MLSSLVVAVWCLVPGVPAAGTADALPAPIQAMMDDAEYAQARKAMDRALRARTLRPGERAALFAAHAVCDVSLGDDAAAAQSFQKLLTLQPDYAADPNRTSPKVLEVYELVRARMLEQGALDSAYQPEFQPVVDVAAGDAVPLRVAFHADAAAGITRVYFRFRRVGEPSFESVELAPVAGAAATFAGSLPGSSTQTEEDSTAVDYYLDALAPDGNRLTGVGTGALPLQFRIAPLDARTVPSQPGAKAGPGVQAVLQVVMPVVLGGVAVAGVLAVTVVILGLTALDPGASHLFIRRFQ